MAILASGRADAWRQRVAQMNPFDCLITVETFATHVSNSFIAFWKLLSVKSLRDWSKIKFLRQFSISNNAFLACFLSATAVGSPSSFGSDSLIFASLLTYRFALPTDPLTSLPKSRTTWCEMPRADGVRVCVLVVFGISFVALTAFLCLRVSTFFCLVWSRRVCPCPQVPLRVLWFVAELSHALVFKSYLCVVYL